MALILSDRVRRFTGRILRTEATDRNIIVLLSLLVLGTIAEVTTPSRYLLALVHVLDVIFARIRGSR